MPRNDDQQQTEQFTLPDVTARRVYLIEGVEPPEGVIDVTEHTPFRPYEHCRDGDWGVLDAGRFNTEVSHGWSRPGAHRFAVACYRQKIDEYFPPSSLSRYVLAESFRGKNLGCSCPRGFACHVDVLLEICNAVD